MGSLDCGAFGLLGSVTFTDACASDSFALEDDALLFTSFGSAAPQNEDKRSLLMQRRGSSGLSRSRDGDNDDARQESLADLLEVEGIVFDGATRLMDVNQEFVFHAEIGAGHFGRVFECMRRVDGRLFACKQLDKRKIRDPRTVRREVTIMRRLKHPHILQIVDVYEIVNDAWIVTELCDGGDLMHHLMRRGGTLSEAATRIIAQQILSALEACHSAGVVHRDIKPENVLIHKKPTDDNDVHIKVIDFGLSCIYDGETELHRVVGTPYYMAPEVLGSLDPGQGGYTSACDLWSTGVILYLLLCGRPPFSSNDEPFIEGAVRKRKRASIQELKQRIMAGDFALDFGSWLRCSTEACELVTGLLRVDSRLRLTAKEALNHVFIRATDIARNDPEPLGAAALEALSNFARTTFFHKRLYTTLAETLTTRELRILRSEFEALDHDKDGLISIQDLCSALKRREHASSQIEVEAIFEACQLPSNHLVSYDEFVLASVHRCRYLREDRVDKLFKQYLDATPGEPYVTADSLRAHGLDDAAINEIFHAAKTKIECKIDRDEFDALLRRPDLGSKGSQPRPPCNCAGVSKSRFATSSKSVAWSDSSEISFKVSRTNTHDNSGSGHTNQHIPAKAVPWARDSSRSLRKSMSLEEDQKEEGEQYLNVVSSISNSTNDDAALASLPHAPSLEDGATAEPERSKRPDLRARLRRMGVSDESIRLLTPSISFTPRPDGPFFSDSEKQLHDIVPVLEEADKIDSTSPDILGKRAAAALAQLKEFEVDLDRILQEADDDDDKRMAESKYLDLAAHAMQDCKAAAIMYRTNERLGEAITAYREAKNLEFILEQRGVQFETDDPSISNSEASPPSASFSMPPPSDSEVQRRAERIIPRKRRTLAQRFISNTSRFSISFKRKR